MSTQAVNPWVSIAVAAIPEVAGLIKAILDLQKAYPAMTPAQIQAIVADLTTAADGAFDAVLAKIDRDATAHPG